MPPSVPPATAALRWSVQTVKVAGLSVPIARVEIDLYLPMQPLGSAPVYWKAWFDTAAPLSVIPYRIHSRGLVWQPLPGVHTTWAGLPCDVGHVEVWLIDTATGALEGPFRMLAKFPRRDPPGNPSPLLVGLEFVLAHQGAFHVPPHPSPGELRVS